MKNCIPKQRAPRNRTITLTDNEILNFKKRLIKIIKPVSLEEIENKTTTKHSICQLIRENKQITRIELAQKIGVSESAIKQQLATLKKAGTIKRIGSTKDEYWLVIK